MKTLCIVPCGRRKIWDDNPKAGPAKAKDVYTGPFAKKCKEYALKCYPSSWCTISAKYGFLFPDDIVPGPYNVTFNDPRTNPISTEELLAQAKQKKLYEYDRFVVIGGKEYVTRAKEVFASKEIITPLSGSRGIGDMMHKLEDLIRKDR